MSKSTIAHALLEVMVAVYQGSVWAESYKRLQSGYGEIHEDVVNDIKLRFASF